MSGARVFEVEETQEMRMATSDVTDVRGGSNYYGGGGGGNGGGYGAPSGVYGGKTPSA
ncbi:hypothetical protein F2Q69_00002130 [Brassica cretica]|uniref:Uncharacterized protein n=1 Tax=Brassica cretica TaxID=69181 RepID=A0A8S9P4I6_BRACR|nr:hypothetical protein F2Q69_00002130 [Brassica cretica]